MAINQIIQTEDDGKVTVTAVTEQGNCATSHYYKSDADSTIDDRINQASEEALRKDD